jgi:hypothetical protein
MKPARQTFLILSGIGILGTLSNTWQRYSNAASYHSSQFSETFKEVFSFAGLVNNLAVPLFFAGYVAACVLFYTKLLGPKTPGWNKWLRILMTVFLGVVVYLILLGIFFAAIR